jgi:hypothetical protein
MTLDEIKALAWVRRHPRQLADAQKQSDCLRRVGGKWYSFFEMQSFPANPMTARLS